LIQKKRCHPERSEGSRRWWPEQGTILYRTWILPTAVIEKRQATFLLSFPRAEILHCVQDDSGFLNHH